MKAAGKKAVQAAGKAAKTQVEESQTPKDFKSTINPRDSFPKNHKARITIHALAGVAKPNPKMGQALGPLGINMMAFCKEFNARTAKIKPDVPLRAVLLAYPDRTFKFLVKPPETSWFLRKCSGNEKFTQFSGLLKSGEIDIRYIYEIAKIKKEFDPHLIHVSLESICKSIMGQAHNFGLSFVGDLIHPEPVKIPFK